MIETPIVGHYIDGGMAWFEDVHRVHVDGEDVVHEFNLLAARVVELEKAQKEDAIEIENLWNLLEACVHGAGEDAVASVQELKEVLERGDEE